MDKSNKEWSKKMDQLRHHETDLDLGLEWEILEERLDSKKKRRPVFLYIPVLLGLAALILQLLNHTSSSVDLTTIEQIGISNMKMETENEAIKAAKHESLDNEMTTIESVKQINDLKEIIRHEAKRNDSPISMNGPTNREASAIRKVTKFGNDQMISADQNLGNSSTNFINNSRIEVSNIIDDNKASDIGFYNHTIGMLNRLNAVIIYKEKFDISSPISIQHVMPSMNSFWMDASFSIGKIEDGYQLLDLEKADLMNQKRNSDKSLEAVMTKLVVGKDIGKGFFVKGGMNFVQINERFSFESIDTIQKIYEGETNEIYTDYNGLVSIVSGDKNIVQIVSNQKIRYNDIRIYSAAFGLGKLIKFGAGNVAVAANISVPITTSFNGQSLININQIGSLDQIYADQRNIQYGIQIHYAYPVFKNIDLYGGYDYTFNKLSTNLGYTKNQRIHFLTLGMSYYFN